MIYPRSLAGMNLNPKNDEKEFQQKLQEFLLEKDINILSEVWKKQALKSSTIFRTNKIYGALEKKKKSKKIKEEGEDLKLERL